MSSRTRERAGRLLGMVAMSSLLLAGCAQPATTTTIDAEGNSVTIDWVDYPAHAGVDADNVLVLPVAEEVEARADRLIGEVQDALQAEYGIDGWSESNEGGWYPEGGNSYGGTSLLTTYNSASHDADIRIPIEQWDDVINTVKTIAERFEITEERNDTDADARSAWMRVGTFHRGAEFFDVVIQDETLNPDHTADGSDEGLMMGMSLFYGITTISETDRDEFIQRAAPFEGLTRPDATTSD